MVLIVIHCKPFVLSECFIMHFLYKICMAFCHELYVPKILLTLLVLRYGSCFELMFLIITLWTNSEDDKLMIFFLYFSQKTGFCIPCKLSPLETIYMKCLIQFSGEKKKKCFKMSSAANFTQSAKC